MAWKFTQKQMIDTVNVIDDWGHGLPVLSADGVKKIEAIFKNWWSKKNIRAVTDARTIIDICSSVIWPLSCDETIPIKDITHGWGKCSIIKNT